MIDWQAAGECSALSAWSGCLNPAKIFICRLWSNIKALNRPNGVWEKIPRAITNDTDLWVISHLCVCSRSRALGQETSSLSLRPLRRTRTPGVTSLCWHPKDRPKPSTDPHTAATKPHLDSYILPYISEANNNSSISKTQIRSAAYFHVRCKRCKCYQICFKLSVDFML